ncbi:Uncharacterised protein g5910 [Pycnogonum litorale]
MTDAKASKVNTKLILNSPFDYKWELITNPVQQEILDEFAKLCKKFHLAFIKPAYGRKMDKNTRLDVLAEKRKNDPGRAYRSKLSFGLNHAAKSLERNIVKAVVIDRCTPKIMYQHIKQLCATRDVPVVCIEDFSNRVCIHLSLKRVHAIAVLKNSFEKEINSNEENVDEEDDVFSEFVEIIKKRAPKPPESLTMSTERLEDQSSSSDSQLKNSESKLKREHEIDDYYIYKTGDKLVDPFLNVNKKPDKSIERINEDIFISDNAMDCTRKRMQLHYRPPQISKATERKSAKIARVKHKEKQHGRQKKIQKKSK